MRARRGEDFFDRGESIHGGFCLSTSSEASFVMLTAYTIVTLTSSVLDRVAYIYGDNDRGQRGDAVKANLEGRTGPTTRRDEATSHPAIAGEKPRLVPQEPQQSGGDDKRNATLRPWGTYGGAFKLPSRARTGPAQGAQRQ